ncbi:MAG TPA: hypothetical protein VJ840_01940 [Gemmatimonadaceae bacterium]|nr:hypothetical protein [Gemmatimonadaceae bacterium]
MLAILGNELIETAVIVAASAVAILLLGYAYVAMVFMLRRLTAMRGFIESAG